MTIKSAQIASHAGGLPRAMLGPRHASVGKEERLVLFVYQNNELIIDYSVLDIYYPYPLLIILAFVGIIISTDPE